MKSGAEILLLELKRLSVDTIFGYPGASILSVYDAIYKNGGINHILSVDERGAIFMAEGYARSTGKVGVCMATSGPGATNLVTGIADAFSDSIPLVVITGNVSVETLGHDGFQEVDTAGVTMPITKYNYIVKNIKDLAVILDEAFYIASSGRKGPVLIDIPSNIFDEMTDYKVVEAPRCTQKTSNISDAIKLINESTRPLIYSGGGVIASDTSDIVLALSKKLNAPVGVSLRGIGSIPTNYPMYIGVSTSQNEIAKEALRSADLLLCIGARFSNKATSKSMYNKSLKLVHLDIDKAEIDKIHMSDAYVLGDLKDTLPQILDEVSEKKNPWFEKINDKKPTLHKNIEYIKCLNEHFGNEYIVTTDVGQHQMWVANFYNFDKPRTFITSSGLGAMGFGLSSAIGASIATKKPVLLITGDGSFNMSFNELLTIKKYNLPITIAIMNNSSLGMIREVQKKYYNSHFIDSDIDASVDYVSLASAYGIPGYTIQNPNELKNILKTFDSSKPAIFDCRLNKDNKSL